MTRGLSILAPKKTESEFNKILSNSGETLHINEWDTWSVEGKDSKVIVISDLEIF